MRFVSLTKTVLATLLVVLSAIALFGLAGSGCAPRRLPAATQPAAAEPAPATAQPALAAAEPAGAWSPFDLGTHHRAVSTSSEAAQRAFDQGLVWAFAFNHDEAQRAFEEAARQDPRLAMAYWGIALVNGPHINNPGVDEAHARAAWTALQRARELAPGASEVERALIDALGRRYAWPQPADRAPLDAAYAAAMADVARRYPDDADVATLYAEALMDTRPWDQWTGDGRPQPGTAEILQALATARRLDPRHPGALHLTVHALEASPHPEQAAEAADALRTLVPDASHLLHMPSHIDIRTGRWEDGARANERAMAADARYAARRKDPGFYALYMAHNTHFRAFVAMMQGDAATALARTREIVASLPPQKVRANPLFMDAFLTVELDALKRFGRWQEILAAPLPPEEFPVARTHAHFARGVAFAADGDLAAAERERDAYRRHLARIPEDAFWGSNLARPVLAVADPYLAGEIALRRGDLDAAAARLAEAARLEDGLKYDEPPPWTTPVRHALGAVLLQARRPAEAEAVYRADLVRFPENGWSLWGLAAALEGAGKKDDAALVKARFEKSWAQADAPIASSCACVRPAS